MYLKKICDYFLKMLIATIMSFSLVYPLVTTLRFTYSPLRVGGIVLLVLFTCSVLFLNKTAVKVSVFLIPISIAATITILLTLRKDIFYRIAGSFRWLYYYINGETPLIAFYSLVITLLFCVLIVPLVYIFTFKKFNFIIIMTIGIAIYVSQWVFDFFVDEALISFYLFIFSVLVYYFIHIYNKKSFHDSNDFTSASGFILSATPICILVLLLSYLVPVNARPIEWPWLDRKIGNTYSFLVSRYAKNELSNVGYFSLSTAGFGSGNTLGGNIKPNNTKVMEVTGPKSLYLRGRSSDLYNGNSWTNSNITIRTTAQEFHEMDVDIHEMKSGISLLFNEQSNSYISSTWDNTDFYGINMPFFITEENVNLSYADLTTKSLFVPLKSKNFSFASNFSPLTENNDNITVNQDGIFSSETPLTKGYIYNFSTYNIKYSDNTFIDIMRHSQKGLYLQALQNINDRIYDYILNNVINHFANHKNSKVEWSNLNERELWSLILAEENIFELEQKIINYLENFFISNQLQQDMAPSHIIIQDEFVQEEYSSSHVIIQDESEVFSSYYSPNSIDYQYLTLLLKEDVFQNLLNRREVLAFLKNNSNEIYAKYLQTPETLPERVKELAVSITKDETNDYDKVKAIEQYLSTNFAYTLSPGNTPAGKDFADYFLFDLQKGYCTYFATSMTILTRCLGIPSRYIEGFILPSITKKGYTNVYEITNQQAHAWTEVYFEGIGWIPFEPTSSFSNSLYNDATTWINGQGIPYNPYDNYSGGDIPQHPNYTDIGEHHQTDSLYDTIPYSLALAIIFCIVLLILLILLFNAIKRRLRYNKIRKMDSSDCTIRMFEYFLMHLKYQGAPFKAGETPLEYAKRLDNYGYLYPFKFKEIADVFIKARYSPLKVSEAEKNTVCGFYKKIFSATRKNLGLFKYFLVVHILGKV